MKTIHQFIKEKGIQIKKIEQVDKNPNNPEWKDANHYKIILKEINKHQMTIYFSAGYGIASKPDEASILDCMASDSSSIENTSSFEDWANDVGYDTDSRKAEKIYNACVKQADKLKAFLDEESYNELLWEVERL